MINTEAAIKQQNLTSIDSNFLMGLRNDDTGFAGVSSWEMMDYLYTNHGNIEYENLVANKHRLTDPFDPTQPIFNHFKCYKDIRTLTANGGQPI